MSNQIFRPVHQLSCINSEFRAIEDRDQAGWVLGDVGHEQEDERVFMQASFHQRNLIVKRLPLRVT